MRIDPTPPQTEEQKKNSKERVDAITKKVAIVVAFVSVFVWFVKIIFL